MAKNATIETSKGTIKAELFDSEVPGKGGQLREAGQ